MTRVVVSQRKWLYKYKNGNDFSELQNDTTINVIGNQFERIKFVATIKTWTDFDLDNYYITDNSLNVENGDFTGVSVGDRCRIFFIGFPSDIFIFDVTAVNEGLLLFNVVEDTTGIVFPQTFSGDNLTVETDLTYLKYKWGLTSSNETPTYQSYLDGQTLSYQVKDIGLRPTPVDARDINFVSGVKTAINSNEGDFRVRFAGKSQIPEDNTGNFFSVQEYEIEHEFVIQNFTEGQIENIFNSTLPDSFNGEVTLNYDSEFEFRTIESSPETSKIGEYTSLGDIGFFGENFNDRPNLFNISNLEIRRDLTNELLPNVSSNELCNVSFTISSDEDSFEIDPTIIINHFTLRTDFAFKKIGFTELFNFEDVRIQNAGNIENGTKISSASFIKENDNTLNVSFSININDSELEGVGYLFSVNVGDFTLENFESNRVNVLVHTGDYEDNFDILGLIGDPIHDLYLRGCTEYNNVGSTSFPMTKASLIMTKILIPILDGVIDSIDLQTVAVQGDNVFSIDTERIDTSGFVLVNGLQEINEILPNPYLSTIPNGSINHLGNKEYLIIYPFRMPYDETREVDGLPDVLFDNTRPNNGKNEDTFYIQGKGLNIHIAYKIGMLKDNRVTFYRYRTPVIQIRDFKQPL